MKRRPLRMARRTREFRKALLHSHISEHVSAASGMKIPRIDGSQSSNRQSLIPLQPMSDDVAFALVPELRRRLP